MNTEVDQLRELVNKLSVQVSEMQQLQQRELSDSTGTFSSGDTAWMLTSCALVLFMTLPGLFMFYGGMARTKNVLAVITQVVSTACLVTFLWLCFGYSLAFAPAQGDNSRSSIFGDRSRFWLTDLRLGSYHQLAPNIPESVFCIYQLTFAIITPCLMVGAFADRIKFNSMLILMALWHLLVYCPVAHSMWHPNGFLYNAGALDFAGGNVVHITSGVSGLVTTIYLGPRLGFGIERFDSHNVMLTAAGACMLWVGWFGFNAGSALGATEHAGFALLCTQISVGTAGLSWMFTEWLHAGRPSVLGLVSGVVSGLVVITPGAGFVDQTGAFIIGLLGGVICYGGVQLKHLAGYDDALDAFGVHGVGGTLGGILVGFFAVDSITGNDQGVFYSDTYNGGRQLGNQLFGIVVTIGWSIFMTTIILVVIDMCCGLRISEDAEDKGDEDVFGHTLADNDPNHMPVEKIDEIETHG